MRNATDKNSTSALCFLAIAVLNLVYSAELQCQYLSYRGAVHYGVRCKEIGRDASGGVRRSGKGRASSSSRRRCAAASASIAALCAWRQTRARQAVAPWYSKHRFGTNCSSRLNTLTLVRGTKLSYSRVFHYRVKV
jgi:hypothetical protein